MTGEVAVCCLLSVVFCAVVCTVACCLLSVTVDCRLLCCKKQKNILIGGQASNPGVLNSWLRANNGYDANNDLEEAVVPQINPTHISWPSDGMHTKNDLPYATIAQYLKAGRPVIANVMHGGHFVLVVGYDADGDTLYVNDPGFSIPVSDDACIQPRKRETIASGSYINSFCCMRRSRTRTHVMWSAGVCSTWSRSQG